MRETSHNCDFPYRGGPLSVAVVMTGGTIAKTYDPLKARLVNTEPKLKEIIAALRTDDIEFHFHDMMHLDSLEIGPEERNRITTKTADLTRSHDGVLVSHGTDSLADTATELCSQCEPPVPVVFTGAFVPFTVTGSDAVQNVTEALLALRMLPAGVYLSMHNRILTFPGARKDYANLTFAGVD